LKPPLLNNNKEVVMIALPFRQELANYYTAWIWPDQSMEWMKSLLLFFDGLALALPQKHCDTVIDTDPVLAQPLQAAGLLHNFDPEVWMTKPIAAEIRRAAHTALRRTDDHHSMLRAGITTGHFIESSEVSQKIIDEMLKSRVVTCRRPDLGSDMVEMTPLTLKIVLTIVALTVRATATDYDIHLVTDYYGKTSDALKAALCSLHEATPASSLARRGLYTMPAGWRRDLAISTPPPVGLALAADIEDVGIDLTGVPLDEVLDYRTQHGDRYRAYARALRNFATDLASVTPQEQDNLLRDRIEEIADHAAALRKARRALIRPAAAFAMSAAGAAWTIHQGDSIGAIFAALSALAGFAKPSQPSSAFTYLFGVRNIPRATY
jgi:hypothetical protein